VLAIDKIDKDGIREINGKTHKFILGSQRYKSYDWSSFRTGLKRLPVEAPNVRC